MERKKYQEALDVLLRKLQDTPEQKIDGHLNYVITVLFKKLYSPRYFNYNRAIGVLECIKQEFYRRIVSSYEDTKIEEHGDV